MLISGTIYLYPGYSSNLKSLLGYNTEQIDFIGTLLNAGTWAGVVGGFFYDSFGPKLTCIGGGMMIFAGYFTMYLSAGKLISSNYIVMAIFAFVAGQGSGWVYTAALNTNADNFTRADRGKIMGVLTCCFGLCSGVFTLIMKTFYPTEVVNFLLFLSVCLPVVAFVLGCIFTNFLSEYPKIYSKEIKRVYFGYGIMLTVALWVSITSLVINFTDQHPFPYCIAMLGLIASLVLISLFTSDGVILKQPANHTVNNNEEELSRLVEKEVVSVSVIGEEYNLWRAMLTWDFWLIFYTHFAVIGAGITLLNNLTEIVISKEYPVHQGEVFESAAKLPHAKYATTFVIMFSVFNTIGRLAFGLLSDKFMTKMSRPAWLVVVTFIMALTQVYYFAGTIPMLFGAVVLHGLAYGGAFALVPTLTVEIFGMKYFGANYGFIGIAPAVGSELVATLLAGKLNDYYKETYYITIGKDTHCFGSVCFRYTLFVTFGLCLTAIASSFALKYVYLRRIRNVPPSGTHLSCRRSEDLEGYLNTRFIGVELVAEH